MRVSRTISHDLLVELNVIFAGKWRLASGHFEAQDCECPPRREDDLCSRRTISFDVVPIDRFSVALVFDDLRLDKRVRTTSKTNAGHFTGR